MTALPSHLPAFSFFGGSLFFLRWPFLSRCCFLLFPPANFLFSSAVLFSPSAAFLVPLPFFFSLLQAFSFFCGSLFPSGGLSRPAAVFLFSPASFFFLRRFSFSLCSLSCSATVSLGVFQGRGAFRPPLFRGLKYCKRSDKKKGGRRCMRKPPVKVPWRPESVRVAVVPADPPKSDRSRKCALSTAVTGRRTVKTSCLRESAASGRTGV